MIENKEILEDIFTRSNSECMSEDIRQFGQAFLLAKAEFSATGADTRGNYGGYAKIDAIYRAVEGPLMRNNISIWHMAIPKEGTMLLFSRLTHVMSGQYIQDVRIMESEKPGNQGKGAANTYMRKYAILSMCALSTEDDDGQEEDDHIQKNKKESAPKNSEVVSESSESTSSYSNTISPAQLGFLKTLLKGDVTREERICNYYKIPSLDQLHWKHMNEVRDKLKRES